MKLKNLVISLLLCAMLVVYVPGETIVAEAKQVTSLDISNSESWYSGFDYSDPMWISDEEFFGEYDATTGEWIQEPFFLYDDYPGLAPVKECVMEGDYENAKILITDYYRTKFQNQPRTFDSSTAESDILKSQLMAYNAFFLSGTNLDIMYFGDEESVVEGDILPIITAMTTSTATDCVRTFELMAFEKDGVTVTAHSRESGQGPYAIVQVNGANRRFEATYDTYLSGDTNKDTNYGTQETLKISEDSDLSKTARTRITIDFTGIEKGDIVTSASLYLNGWSDAQDGTPKKISLIYTENGAGETNVEDLTWGNDASRLYVNFDGERGPILHKDNFTASTVIDPYVDFKTLYKVYRGTGDEMYAYHLFRLYNDFIINYGERTLPVYTGGKLSRRLAMGTSATDLPKMLAHVARSEHFTTENFIPILKHAWVLANGLVMYWDGQAEGGNWGLYETTGLASIMFSFIEFADAHKPIEDGGYGNGKRGGWIEVANHRYAVVAGNTLRPDNSFTETTGYGRESLREYLAFENYAIEAGVEFKVGEALKEKLDAIALYIMNTTGPDFKDFQVGDAYFHTYSFRPIITDTARVTGNPILTWAATKGKEGVAPDYTSVFYPDNRSLVSRSGWNDNDIYTNFLSDGDITNHGHPDDLQITMFAYGQYLLSDQKQFSYAKNEPHRAWVYSTRAHNTVEVDGLTHKEYLSSLWNEIETPHGNVIFNRDEGQYEYEPSVVERSEINGGYDYVRMRTNAYRDYCWHNPTTDLDVTTDVDFSRGLLFMKKNKYYFVTDYLVPYDGKEHKYAQNWHTLPDSAISIDEGTNIARTNYAGSNIQIIPVNYEGMTAQIRSGWYSPTNGVTDEAPYPAYERVSDKKTTFNTVLLPTPGETEVDASVTKLNLDVSDEVASAMQFSMTETKFNQTVESSYYALHDIRYKGSRDFGAYTTDGVLAVAENDHTGYSQLVLQDGTILKNKQSGKILIKGTENIPELSVIYDGTKVQLDSSKEIDLEKITVYVEKGITKVTLNGENVAYSQKGHYIYFGDEPIIDDSTEIKPEEGDEGFGGQHGNGTSGDSIGGGGSSGGGGSNGKEDPKPVEPNPEDPKPETPSSDAFKSELSGHWGEADITALINAGVVKGDNGKLNLKNTVTRAELIALIIRAMGLEEKEYNGEFSDVSADDWYAGVIATAKSAGFVDGDGEMAMPNAPVTREQLAKFLVLPYILKNPEAQDGEVLTFADSEEISSWAVNYVNKATALGILNGMGDGTFAPKNAVLREQAFVAIARLMK